MTTPHEQLSAQYLQWELRGRGWFVHQEPVTLEPPFQPFRGYHFQSSSVADDVRRASFAERLMKKAGRLLNPPPLLVREQTTRIPKMKSPLGAGRSAVRSL